tara:strand:- start:280 stop:498 length:219 start_codon:yes stop_codon:yes gene_type:complete
MTKVYAVVFEPFEVDGLEYVKEGCGSMWTVDSPVKTFATKELAQAEADKWNTGQVVEWESRELKDEPDFIME